MALPYESATSGEKALVEIQKLLRGFGCQQFGTMVDEEAKEIRIMFKYRDRQVCLPASIRGYAAAWLKHHPYSTRMRGSKIDHERKAMNIAGVAVYSILRDWIKGQVTAIETGILTFEGAFLGQILLPSGKSVLQHVSENVLLLTSEQP